jgi:hypothetical protein
MNLKRSLTKQVSTRRSTVPSLPSQLDFPASAVSPTTESKFYNVDTSTIRRPEFSPAPTGCPRRRPPPRSGRSPGRPTHPGTGTRWRRCPKFKTVDSYDRAAATLCTMTFSWMTLSITEVSLMVLSIMALSIMALSWMRLIIMALSIMTVSITALNKMTLSTMTLKNNNIQHNDIQHNMKNTYSLFQVKFITEYTNVQHIIITQI